MTPPRQPPRDVDLLKIPEFLKRASTGSRKPRLPEPARPRRRPMPPQSMIPVLRAIRRGRDTMQKLRASLGDTYSDREIEAGIKALIRIGSIHRTGRRYLPMQLRQAPPRKKQR